MIHFKLLFFFLLLSCSNKRSTVNPVTTGKVIAVKDGDTIEILSEGKPFRIRLAHIDCPEIRNSQPFGRAAKTFASDLCFGQVVTILHEGVIDRYGRLVGTVMNAAQVNVNKELVKAGLAWHFSRYSSDSSYALLELNARKKKLGLWQDKNPIAPWEWRKKKEKKMVANLY